MVFKQEVNIPLALTIGLISGILILVMTFGMQAWFESAEQTITAEQAMDAPKSDYVQLKADQWNSIATTPPTWADAAHTSVKIPIADAMKIMVATNGNLPSTQPATQPATTQPGTAKPTASLDVGN